MFSSNHKFAGIAVIGVVCGACSSTTVDVTPSDTEAGTPNPDPNSAPNLLVIHTDEHNFRTLSCYQGLMSEDQAFVWGDGVNIETPNIDRLAAEGAIYTRYYGSSPVSTPSRASFITGLNPYATGADTNGESISEEVPTFGSILRDNGYSTSYVGKWHLDGDSGVQFEFTPPYDGGFTDNEFMMYTGHQPYFLLDDLGERLGVVKVADVDSYNEWELTHMTDYFTDKTLDIIERDKDIPFCAMVAFPNPHTPNYARPPYHTKYDELNPETPWTMLPEQLANRPSWAYPDDSNNMTEVEPYELQQYFGMIKHIDDCVGQMIKLLEDNEILDNTIVVFTSDHGDMFYEHSRMNKTIPYEASARIPYIIRYPKSIAAGKVVETAAVNTDFVPTILSLMGVSTTASFDGEDMSSELISTDMTVDNDRTIFYAKHNGYWAAVCDGRYKLVIDKDESPWMFDLDEDYDETINIYNTAGNEAISAELMAEVLRKLKLYEYPTVNGDDVSYYNLD